jgi:hypothetical protein
MTHIQTLQANYTQLIWQSQLRNQVTTQLLSLLQSYLERECFPGMQFDVSIYGSLHHGLFVPGSSKVNVDVTPKAEVAGAHVLQVLTCHMQMLAWKHSDKYWPLQHPVLLWHRNATRPWALVFSWEGIPVHVTCRNVSGMRVSTFMLRALNDNPSLRLTLLYWKQRLRSSHQTTQYIGPNTGQVSTYALFTILLSCLKELQCGGACIKTFEERARRFAVAYLTMVPKMVRTPDRICETANLTSRSYLAAGLARELENIPQIA